jgi:hypothetical protein
MNFLGANRLRIVQYFDELKAKVDDCVETFIAANHQNKEQVAEINDVRTEWLKEIDQCERFNLTELEKCEEKNSKMQDEKLFKKLIFEFEVSNAKELIMLRFGVSERKVIIKLRLIAIDTNITPGQIECFQIAMKYINRGINTKENCFKKLFVDLEKTNSNVNKNRHRVIHNHLL